MISKLMMYSFCSIFVGIMLTYPLSFIYYVKMQTFRDLYTLLLNDNGLKIMNEWKKMTEFKIKDIIGISLQMVYFVISFYICFGFCTIYINQQYTWLITCVTAILFDLILLEVLMEVLIAILYKYKNKSKYLLYFTFGLNKLRNIRCLI